MINVAVFGFVGADRDDNIAQGRVGREFPIVDGELRRGDVFMSAGVNFAKILRIADDRFLFEIANKAMGCARREEI